MHRTAPPRRPGQGRPATGLSASANAGGPGGQRPTRRSPPSPPAAEEAAARLDRLIASPPPLVTPSLLALAEASCRPAGAITINGNADMANRKKYRVALGLMAEMDVLAWLEVPAAAGARRFRLFGLIGAARFSAVAELAAGRVVAISLRPAPNEPAGRAGEGAAHVG